MSDLADAVESADQTATPKRQGAKLAFGLVWLFTIAALSRPEDLFRIPFHFQLIFGIGAALAYLGALITGRIRFVWSRELILVFLLTAWFTLGVPFAYWRTLSYATLTGIWLKTVFICVLLTQTLTSVGRIRKILWAIIWSELAVASVSILLQHEEGMQFSDRLAGVSNLMLGWNYFGIAVAITLPYIAALYLSSRSLVKTILLLASLGVMMWMLVLTASRGGFLNVVFAIILTWWFVLRGTPRGRNMGFVIGLILAVSIARAPGVFLERMHTVWSGSSDSVVSQTVAAAEESTEGRKFLLGRAMMYTMRYPVFGVGLGNFSLINGTELRRADAWYGTHNTFTQLSAEAGIPALLLFLCLLATLVRHMRKVSEDFADDAAGAELRLLARATLVSVASFVFGGFFAHLAYEYLFYYVAGIGTGLWTIAGESSRAVRRRAESHEALMAIPSTNWSPT